MNKNYVFSLCWNFPSEVEKVTKLLYLKNHVRDFVHIIVDLGFPLESDDLPAEGSVSRNSNALYRLAMSYGSLYMRTDNVGVSQNWTTVCDMLKLEDDDVAIGLDPDEHPMTENWVKAMGDVLRSGFGLVSLMMPEHRKILPNMSFALRHIAGNSVLITQDRRLNWALIGISGSFYKKIGKIPYPEAAPRYGWIETEMYPLFQEHGEKWCVLLDHTVKHTDYELGDAGTSRLLREWKNTVIFRLNEIGQISLEEFIERRRKGLI